MKDIYGQELSIGDYIVYSDGTLRAINTGKITGFTEKRVKVLLYQVDKYAKELKNHYSTVVSPDKLVVVSRFKDPIKTIKPLLSKHAELEHKYISEAGTKCPYCEAENSIDFSDDRFCEGALLYQPVYCTICKVKWDDVYSLEGINPSEDEGE